MKHFVLVLTGLIVLAPQVSAQETTKAIKGTLETTVNIPGIFVADDKDEIKVEPEKYSGNLVVTSIKNEGIKVKKGDLLIEFENEQVDEAIEEAKNEATDVSVELKKAQAELQTAQIDMDTKLAQSSVELNQLEKDVQASIDKQKMELAAKQKAIEDAEYGLENAEADYETLKQMYEEREIDQPVSAEILFEREEKAIAKSRHRIGVLEKEFKYFKRYDQSKDQLDKELAVEKKKAEMAKEKINLQASVSEKRSLLEKAQRKMNAANKKVAELESDRGSMQVASPRDGVLFYGKTGNESPSGVIVMGGRSNDVRKELKIGGRVTTHKILMTVAQMDQLSIKMSVSEDDIKNIIDDLEITIYPDAYPGESFEGKLTKVDTTGTKPLYNPSAGTTFKVMGKCTEDAPQLRSGMNCRVSIHCASDESILLPINYVHTRDGNFFCYLKTGNESEERQITIGNSNAEHAVIVDGLKEGDEVFLTEPKSN